MSLDVNISEPDEFNCIELHDVLNDVAKLKSIDDFRYHVDLISGKGESYIANTFRVVITDTANEDNNVKVIVKTLVNTERQMLFHKLHEREVAVYEIIVPIFNKIQDTKNVNNKVMLPKCLVSCDEKKKEVIILEDLIEDGWSPDVRDSKSELDYTKVHTVLTALAKLHALSFVFERDYPEDFMKAKSQFEDLLYNDNFLDKSKLKSHIFDSFESSLNLVTDIEAKEKLSVIHPKVLDILRTYTLPGKYNVFCHGDSWINNMLFKLEVNKPTHVCFIDFQAVRYASPVTDIIYFLYLCTNSVFRSEYLERLKSDYYDTLKSTLDIYKLDVNSLYPIEDFEDEMNEARQYGLAVAMVELKAVNTLLENEITPQDSEDIQETSADEVPKDTDVLKEKINDVVQESIENGVLDKLFNKIKEQNR